MRRISWATGIIVFALTGTSSAQEAKDAPRVGVVDFGRVFTQYQKATDLKHEMEALLEPFRKETHAIKEAMVHHKALAETPGVDPGVVQDAKGEIQKNKRILEDIEKRARKVIGNKQETQIVALFRELKETTCKLAEERKFDVVLSYGEPPGDPWTFPNVNRAMQALDMGAVGVLYARPGMDLTETVIERLNAAYREKKAKEPSDETGSAK